MLERGERFSASYYGRLAPRVKSPIAVTNADCGDAATGGAAAEVAAIDDDGGDDAATAGAAAEVAAVDDATENADVDDDGPGGDLDGDVNNRLAGLGLCAPCSNSNVMRITS